MSRKKLMREKFGSSCRTGLGRSWRARMRGLAGIGAGQGWGGGSASSYVKTCVGICSLGAVCRGKNPIFFTDFFWEVQDKILQN